MYVTNARQVSHSSAAPEDVIADAQVVILTESACHILGRSKAHIDRALIVDLPPFACPVIDLSAMDEWADAEVNAIVKAHCHPFEVRDVQGLCAELEKLGAEVKNEKIEFGSAAWFAAVPEMEF